MAQLKDTHVEGVLSVGACEDVEAELSKITVNASAESGKKTITTSAWGAVINSIILPEAGTYLVGADYSGTNVCFIAEGTSNKYLMPGGVALITVDARTTIAFRSNTSHQATWTEFLPFYVRLSE